MQPHPSLLCPSPFPNSCRSHSGEGPWLTIGVLAVKDYGSTSNGQAFSKWQLADLKGGELRVVLFGEAHAAHKATVGDCDGGWCARGLEAAWLCVCVFVCVCVCV